MRKSELPYRYLPEYQKKAQRENARAYRDQHILECRQRTEEWIQNNKERYNEYQRNYRATHKEEIRERNKKYYQEHKQELLQRHKQYQQEHKEQIAEQRKQKKSAEN